MSYFPNNANGQAAMAGSAPVVIASNQSVVPVMQRPDPSAQIWKSANYTTSQTGAAIWTPASGKKIVVTHVGIYSYGTTAGKCILWFGASGDTTYNAGTDQPIAMPSFAPSSTSKPGAIPPLPTPIICANADYILRCTTDAALSLEIVIYGYEI